MLHRSASNKRQHGGCHNCAYEWEDPCAANHVHLPSGQAPCLSCIHNPKPSGEPLLDHYTPVKEAVEDLVKRARRIPC